MYIFKSVDLGNGGLRFSLYRTFSFVLIVLQVTTAVVGTLTRHRTELCFTWSRSLHVLPKLGVEKLLDLNPEPIAWQVLVLLQVSNHVLWLLSFYVSLFLSKYKPCFIHHAVIPQPGINKLHLFRAKHFKEPRHSPPNDTVIHWIYTITHQL